MARHAYLALATDYDGTLATEGRVDEEAVDALDQLRGSGRQLVLVTGRQLPDLQQVFPHLDLCDRVVAENGGVLYQPATARVKALGERPSEALLEALHARGVPASAGQVIVATGRDCEDVVLETIRDLGLRLHVIFNKDALMVLPIGLNKAAGLRTALAELQLSPQRVVGVGDAENDVAFLQICGLAVAVANALPDIKHMADWLTRGQSGVGVREVIDAMLSRDGPHRGGRRIHL